MNVKLFFKIVSVFVVESFMLSLSDARAALWMGENSVMNDAENNWNPFSGLEAATGTFAGDAALINNPVLNGAFTIGGLVFNSGGWVLGGSGTLSLGASGISGNLTAGSAAVNINHAISAAAAQNWGLTGAKLNVRGEVIGSGNINITNTTALYGNWSAYTGTLTVKDSRQLIVGASGALGTQTLVVENNAVLSAAADTGPVTLTNDVLFKGNFNFNDNWANQGAGTDSASPLLNRNQLTLTGNIYLSATTTSFEVRSGTLDLAGSISGTNFARSGYRNDGALILSGNNSGLYGTFNINSGQPTDITAGAPRGWLGLNHDYAVGNVSLIVITSNYTDIDNTSGAAVNLQTSASIRFNYTLTFLGSNDLSFGTGLVTLLTPNAYANVKNHTLSFGSLQPEDTAPGKNMTYGPYSFYKQGQGNLIFTGSANLANTKLYVTEGLLAISGTVDTGVYAPADLTTHNSGTIILQGGQYGGNGWLPERFVWSGGSGTVSGLAAYGGDLKVNLGGSGALLNWGGGIFAGNQTLRLGHALSDGVVDIQNSVNLNTNNGVRVVEVLSGSGAGKIDARFSGSLTGGNASFRKTGGGVLELSGNNSYTGTTTVSAGTLLVSGTTGGQGTYVVDAGAILGGHGEIGTANKDVTVSGMLDISGGGVLDGLGTLTLNLGTGKLNLSAAQGLGFILGADGDNDQIKLLGNTGLLWNNALTLGDFNFTLGSGFTGSGTYELMVSDSVLLSSFTDLTGTLGGGAYDATLSLLNGNALTLTVTAIPEPSALLLMLGGAALLFTLRRGKNPK